LSGSCRRRRRGGRRRGRDVPGIEEDVEDEEKVEAAWWSH